jgi:UDP-N-acetylmuramoyl-tripeptide--D-alanyl-D-alanine ligase
LKLEKAIQFMGASAPGIDPALLERDVVSFVIDSREIKAGDVFFALSQPEYREHGFNGDFDDATVYVKQSLEAGAVAAVVREDRFAEHASELEQFKDKLIFVGDGIKALQDLAHEVYLEWNKPVVAITGSAGKTTAKELTAHVLEGSGRKILRNIKNYNNGLGHPLTVLNLAKDDSYDAAVLEMGMSTPQNEIERLCRITPPDVSVVLNVLPVHIEHLGSIERIQQAKAEIVEGMKEGGTAVLNADDPLVREMAEKSRGDVITYGIENPADVTAESIRFAKFGETTFSLVTPSGSADVNFPLNGRHNILNALAAAAVGHRFGMNPAQIAHALSRVQAPSQRGEILRFAVGFTVVNDSYNSNPAALLSMVDTLVEGSEGARRRIVVAGEMLELGEDAAEIHSRVGSEIAGKGVDMLVGVRGFGRQMVDGATEAGLKNSVFAEDSEKAGDLVSQNVREGDVVLVKGSRGVRTEKVIEKLLGRFILEKSTAVRR